MLVAAREAPAGPAPVARVPGVVVAPVHPRGCDACGLPPRTAAPEV